MEAPKKVGLERLLFFQRASLCLSMLALLALQVWDCGLTLRDIGIYGVHEDLGSDRESNGKTGKKGN